jgi:L-rhamnose isomerase
VIDTEEDEAVVNRPGKVTPPRSLRVPDDEWKAWHEAAKAADVTLTDYIRDTVNAKVKRDRRRSPS